MMSERIIIVLASVICCLYSAVAQEHKVHLGVYLAPGTTLAGNKPFLYNGHMRPGAATGLNIYYRVFPNFHVISGVGLDVFTISARDYSPIFGCDANSSGVPDYYHSYYENRDRLTTLDVPLEIRFLPFKKNNHAFFFQWGVSWHFLLSTVLKSFVYECGIPQEIDRNTVNTFKPTYGTILTTTAGCGYRHSTDTITWFIQPTFEGSVNRVYKNYSIPPIMINLALRAGIEF